ncbi:hypothetical protein ACLOJK_037433, partial [Asimina triloba]
MATGDVFIFKWSSFSFVATLSTAKQLTRFLKAAYMNNRQSRFGQCNGQQVRCNGSSNFKTETVHHELQNDRFKWAVCNIMGVAIFTKGAAVHKLQRAAASNAFKGSN